jgi:hypothetical protein
VVQNHGACRLFLPNLQWPVTNVLYGLARMGTWGRSVTCCNYHEGIGSLRLVYPDYRQRLRDYFKRVVAVLLGSRYYPLEADIMGLELCDSIYSLMPEALPEKVRGRAVAIPPFEIRSDVTVADACLFLGQKDDHLPTRMRRLLAEAAADFCAGLGYRQLLFKSHHYGESEAQRQAFTGHGFERYGSDHPVEADFATQPLACVASFNSSALVHLKAMLGERVRCVACFPDEMAKYARYRGGQADNLVQLLAMAGVEIPAIELRGAESMVKE